MRPVMAQGEGGAGGGTAAGRRSRKRSAEELVTVKDLQRRYERHRLALTDWDEGQASPLAQLQLGVGMGRMDTGSIPKAVQG